MCPGSQADLVSVCPPLQLRHQDASGRAGRSKQECCVTAGGRDGTVRVWKIPQETQRFCGHQ